MMEKYTNEEIKVFKKKAEMWDALEEKIGNFYCDKDGIPLSDEYIEENNIDLSTIGETAARAFGYL